MCWPSALYRVALLPDNYRLSALNAERSHSTDSPVATASDRWNEGLYCILPAAGPQVAVVLIRRNFGRPPVLYDQFHWILSSLLLVLVETVLVYVVTLPYAQRVAQVICKVACMSQRRQWTGVTLFYIRNHSLSTKLVVFGQSLIPTAGKAKKRLSSWERCAGFNIGHLFFYTDCPLITNVYLLIVCCSVPTTHIYLKSKRVTSVDRHCNLVSQVVIKAVTVTRQILEKCLEYECWPIKPVFGRI